LSYISSKHAGNSGTNRTTQAETSNLLRLSFPGRVITRELQRQLAEFFGSTSRAYSLLIDLQSDPATAHPALTAGLLIQC
jgi:hypothetical protein